MTTRPLTVTIRRAASLALAVALAASPIALAVTPATSPAGDGRIIHALNRLTFGPRPGDIEKVRAMGLERWIDEQLHPERIPDAALQARLVAFRTLELSSAEILKGYDPPRELKREIQKRRSEMGEDASEQEMRRVRRELNQEYRGQMAGAPRLPIGELQQAKILRAAYSERQLDEVIADFWLNHFNVFANKGADRYLVTAYERDVIRPHAWGRFEDLLLATAKSPAMLFYLDNWLSVSPDADMGALRRAARGGEDPMNGRRRGGMRRRGGVEGMGRRPGNPQAPPPGGRRAGLNENYAREIMELHTLGVEGGYTQQDVKEVARALTGWTIKGLRQNQPEFMFLAAAHDKGDKTVLGRTIASGGVKEGEQVIHMLATHPSTARFISYKLARRFVADEPPASLVDRAAAVFRKTDGDIREVVRTIVTSPEFDDAPHRQAKVKTPLEFVVSAVRASGAEVSDARAMAQRLAQMGMPLYQQQPPTGYKDTAETWVSTNGLLARLNFALDLVNGRVAGVRIAPERLDTAQLVPAGLSDATRQTLEKQTASGLDVARVAGLILGSPEFQRR